MKIAQIAKIVNKANKMHSENPYSIGFCRLTSLPQKIRKAFNLACLLDGMAVSEVTEYQKSVLGAFDDVEFKNWMVANA